MKRSVTVLLLLLAFGVASCSRPPQGSTLVLVVRHAEKASDAEYSPLSDAGILPSYPSLMLLLPGGPLQAETG